MSLVSLKEITKYAVSENYAVAAPAVFDYMFAEGALCAAEDMKTPIIMMFGNTPLVERPDYYPNFYNYLVNRCKNSSVPVCVHLDHGPSFAACAHAIRAGATSIMIDGSMFPYEKNVAVTKKVVEMAHASGIDVEAEIGHVGANTTSHEALGEDDNSIYTEPEMAHKFVEDTNCDALAIAIGTAHGIYKEKPILNIDVLKQIRKELNIPLVLHGASGLTEQDFANVVDGGINKINICTSLVVKAAEDMLKAAQELPSNTPHFAIAATEFQTGYEETKKHIEWFKTKAIKSAMEINPY
ncbi:MAG: ketose-bisphosphate aldolase [Suipraeoptans sp.]